MVEWFNDLIYELIEEGQIFEVEPGIVQLTGGEMRMSYHDMVAPNEAPPPEVCEEMKEAILAMLHDHDHHGGYLPFELN